MDPRRKEFLIRITRATDYVIRVIRGKLWRRVLRKHNISSADPPQEELGDEDGEIIFRRAVGAFACISGCIPTTRGPFVISRLGRSTTALW